MVNLWLGFLEQGMRQSASWYFVLSACALSLSFFPPRQPLPEFTRNQVSPTADDTASYPTYQRTLQLETEPATSANMSFGDVDGDGTMDIVLAKGRHWPLVDRVILTDGRGHIRRAYDLGTASDRTYAGRLVDLDGNGTLDVVISNDAPDPKLVYLNDGKGHFRVGSQYGHPEWETRNASVVDVNGDGRPDIIAANRSDKPQNYVCLNDGHGAFSSDCRPFARYSATTITPGDMNHDGQVDLVVPNRDGGQSYVYLGDGRGDFSDERRVPFGPANASIRICDVADFNGDGNLDIVASDERTGVALYLGKKDGTFGPASSIEGPSPVPYALAVGDLNGDGAPDIVVGHVEAPSVVFFNGDRGARFTAVHFGDNKGTVYGFAIGDLDHDGVLDIGTARSEAVNMVYFGARPVHKGP
ncbi:MAG: VCBS repeat-containing protein [Gemmatimonadaceae bacterium]